MVRSVSFSSLLLLIAGCQSAMDYTVRDRNARVEDFVDRELRSNTSPGIQYVVLNADSTVMSCARGTADIAELVPVRENTTFMMYSMTKTITAAAVLQLAEHGYVSLDDPITQYLPDVPYGKEVTIRRLLAQTSGIPDPIPLAWVHLVEEHPAFDENAALSGILRENPELDFAPGTKYAYSNISYWLLGHLIARVSGTSYAEYVRKNIFDRLDLPVGEIGFVIPARERHSKGYLPKWSFMNLFKSFVIDSRFVGEYEDGWLHINDHYLNGPAFGGIVASARAIGGFLRDQLQDSSGLFSPTTSALFFEQQRDNTGTPVEMTLGWHIGRLDTLSYFFKEGGGGGFHSEMRVYPSYGIASVVVANNTSFDVKAFLNAADREFFAE